MQKSKLTKLYKTLNEKELERFKQFINSPLHNTNQKLIFLAEFMDMFHNNQAHPEFTKVNAYKYVFQDESTPNPKTIIKLASKLMKLLEQFIYIDKICNDEIAIKQNLLEHYSKHSLENEFLNTYKHLKKDISQEIDSTEKFHYQFLLEKAYNHFISTKKDSGTGGVHFDSTIKALDSYFIINKLIYECQKYNRNQIISDIAEKEGSIDLSYIPTSDYLQNETIQIWYSAYLLLKDKTNKKLFQSLKEQILYKKNPIPKNQERIIFTYLENSTIHLYKDRYRMYEELFSLYQFQYKNGILLNKSSLVPNIIRNYVSVALKIGEIKKAEEFIADAKTKASFKDVIQLSEANILFEKDKFEAIIDILNQWKSNNIYLKIEERRLRIKTYFHLNLEDLNFDACNSFRVFLTENKKKINPFHLHANRNFINFILRLLKNSPSAKPITLLRELSEINPITDKEWIEEQLTR